MTRLSDDARFESIAKAADQERANRPKSLVILAGLLVAASGIAAAAGWWSKASAQQEFDDQAVQAFRVQKMIGEWRDLQASQELSAGDERGQRIPNIISRMESLATRAGLKAKPNPPPGGGSNTDGGVLNRYRYVDVRDESLQAMIDWIRLATEEIPGMEVEEIPDLRPENTGWKMTVIFRRWERTEK